MEVILALGLVAVVAFISVKMGQAAARPGRGPGEVVMLNDSPPFLSVGFWLYVASFVYYRRQVRRGAVPSRSLSSLSWARPGLASRVHPKPDGAGADARLIRQERPPPPTALGVLLHPGN